MVFATKLGGLNGTGHSLTRAGPSIFFRVSWTEIGALTFAEGFTTEDTEVHRGHRAFSL